MSHKYGQVFLKDPNIVRKILETAAVKPEDAVLEIGCGDGAMSLPLAALCRALTIVEIDPIWHQHVQDLLADTKHVTVIESDVLECKLEALTQDPVKVVANIPYYISAKLVQWMIANLALVSSATLMVQKEFGEKLLAKPDTKTYTSLTVFTSYYFEVKKNFLVSKKCFRPIPDVDSMVITLTPRKTPLFEVDADLFFTIIRAGFWGRRKPLKSALKKNPYLPMPGVDSLPFFEAFPNIRAESLDLGMFFRLYGEIKVSAHSG